MSELRDAPGDGTSHPPYLPTHLTGQSSDRLNSGAWNLLPANGHGKWETEPVFSVSQSTKARKGTLAEFSPPGEYRSLSEPGDSPVCIPSPLLSLHVTRGWRKQLEQKDNVSNSHVVILQTTLANANNFKNLAMNCKGRMGKGGKR